MRRECDVFARYLTGEPAPPNALRHYVRWHQAPELHAPLAARGTGFDRLLVAVGRSSWPGLRLADAYSGRLLRTGLLRRKLILVLSLLESTAPTSGLIDQVGSRTKFGFWAGMVIRAGWSGCVFVVSIGVLLPLHVVCSIADRPVEEELR